jgi:hypothetical protein
MKLTKLTESYPKLSAIEIVRDIADGRIRGQWITENNKATARMRVQDDLSEKDALELLDQIDNDRQGAYNFWDMFN